MTEPIHETHGMIAGMTPTLRPGEFVFVTVDDRALAARLSASAIATFEEPEGLSMLVPVETARDAALAVDQPMRQITLNVYSSLQGVGLTAAVSAALAEQGIACNMIAAFHHDHVFVPSQMCERAIEVLMQLQESATKAH